MTQRWTLGRARKGRPITAYRDARISRGGQRWTGNWHVEDGRLVLSSAWGSSSEPAEPGASAEALADRARAMLTALIGAAEE